MSSDTDRVISRRQVLSAIGATTVTPAFGAGTVVADDEHDHSGDTGECPEATLRPSTVHYDDSIHEVCSDDHPATRALQTAVGTSLAEAFPTVGALIDSGYIPYFDFFTEGGVSHWINPEFIGNDSMVDPTRPESVLVDHRYWRPIGMMFVATVAGERQDPPPAVYEDDGACVPWHAHVGFPGRYAWWKYQTVYGDGAVFPCQTPWLLHVWKYPHPESIYAHDAPEYRGGPPAEDPGFETDADPDEEILGPEHLPDALWAKVVALWWSHHGERPRPE